ncbi:MAG: DUF4062 domain-containing protein [Armatimonadetes bacterium]|nr:DUF4062 domain-containing protein [Armatimonadota bacterium]
MNDIPRSIRVFVSSTFRDMVAERDELATHAWPSLRALCEDRAVTFTDIDLRWGITREQAERGEVLPICFAEIDASRPYFVGILGERYGWVPEEIPEHLVEQMPWLAEHRSHSVTELEIVHGVLNDPEMAGRAFFYFRDPEYSEGLPEEKRPTFAAENLGAATKLEALKARIRASGLPLKEGFRTPSELAQQVVADLTYVIDEVYPLDASPDPLERARLAHKAYALSRRGVYIGRESYFDALDEHAAGDGPPLVVTGESGGGKSALLVNWAARYRGANPDASVVEHYCGAGADAADWAAMCRRIAGELSHATGVEAELPDAPGELKTAFKEALYRFAAAGRLVILIDGVNQLEDRDAAPDIAWLPPVLPESMRLILSTLPGRTLDEARRREWRELEVAPLTERERSLLITDYLASFARNVDAALAKRIADAPQAANPLYVRVLIDELRVTAGFEDLDDSVKRYLAAPDPAALYGLVLERWERDYERHRPGLVGDTMSALWGARRGLSETELLEVLGEAEKPLPRARFSPLYLAARTSIVSRSGMFGFAHDFLRSAVEHRYLRTEAEQGAVHRVLAVHFAGLGSRALDERPWQLMAAGAWAELVSMLTRADTLRAVLLTVESHDVRRYWVALEAAGVSADESYAEVLESVDDEVRAVVGSLLADLGHAEAAAALLDFVRKEAARSRDVETGVAALDALSIALEEGGDFLGALDKVRRLSWIYRLAREDESLQFCLAREAQLLYAYGFSKKALRRLRKVERICRRRGYYGGLATTLLVQAHAFYDEGEFDGALAVLKEVERLARERGDSEGLTSALSNQARALEQMGDMAAAGALRGELQQLGDSIGDRTTVAVSIMARAETLRSQGDLDGALSLYQEQERAQRAFDASDLLASTIGAQASILRAQDDVAGALRLLREQEIVYREILERTNHNSLSRSGQDRVRSLAACLGEQADLLRSERDLEGALAVLENQVAARQWAYNTSKWRVHPGLKQGEHRREDGRRLAASFGATASILFERGDLDRALVMWKQQESLQREIEDDEGLQVSLGHQASILYDRGDLDGAMALYKEQERMCRQLGNMDGLGIALRNMGAVLALQGRVGEAIPLVEEAVALAERIGLADTAGSRGQYLEQLRAQLDAVPDA